MGLLALFSLALAPHVIADEITGVWATYNNDYIWTFSRSSDGFFFEGERFGFISGGKWTPDGGFFATWSKNDSGAGGSSGGLGGGRGSGSEPDFSLNRFPVTRGRVKFDVVRRDNLGKATMLVPQWLAGDSQAPVTRPTVTYVGPLGTILFGGLYKGEGISVRLGPDNERGMRGVLTTDRSYALKSASPPLPGAPIFEFSLTNPTTGDAAGIGRVAWVPTPDVVKLLRGGSIIPTDRIFIAVNITGRGRRWTYLSQ